MSHADPKPDDSLSGQAPLEDENGVDLTVIRANLRLTPAQRLEQHYRTRMAAQQLRQAGERFHGRPHPDLEKPEG